MKDQTLQSGGSRVTHGSRSEVLGMETGPAVFSRGPVTCRRSLFWAHFFEKLMG